MIGPIVIAEYHQTKHHLWKAVLFFGGATLLLRLFGGNWAAVVLFVGVLPNLGLSLGLGTFAEEFTKGQFKFLFSLPVRRFNIWSVKAISGLLSLVVFATTICSVMFAFPSQELRDLLAFLPSVEVSGTTLVAMLAGICLYSFGVGFFSITACASPKFAGVLSAILLYLPPATLWGVFRLLGSLVPIEWIAFVLAAAGVAFCLGALVLFELRNPFMDAPWGRRIAATALIIATGGIMVACGAIALSWPAEAGPPDLGRVVISQASPDGAHIFVVPQKRLVQMHGYVIAPDGTVIQDLGVGASQFGDPAMTWKPGASGYSVAYMNVGTLVSGLLAEPSESEESEIIIRSIETGETTRIPHLGAERGDAFARYHCWSSDGRFLYGTKTDWRSAKSETTIFTQSSESGESRQIGPAYQNVIISFFPSGYALVVPADRGDEEAVKLTLVDLAEETQQDIALPPDSSSILADSSGKSLVFLHKYIESNTVGYEILRQAIATGERDVIVDRDSLPSTTLEKAARDQLGWVGFSLSPEGRWLTCTVSSPGRDESNTEFLVDLRDRKQLSLPAEPDGSTYVETIMSPGGTRMAQVIQFDALPGEGEDAESYSTSTELCVFSLEGEEPVKLCSNRVETYMVGQQWLGEDALIYLQGKPDAGILNAGSELWKLDVSKGIPERIVAKLIVPDGVDHE